MSESPRDFLRRVLALPLEEQREALLPAYRATMGAFGRDMALNTLAFADDYVFRLAGSVRIPGFPDELHGRESYERQQVEVLDHLNVQNVIVDDVMPLGDGRVAAFYRFVVGAGTGTIEQQCLDLHEFRDGELIRQTVWFDRADGLRELGL